jgi:hypothetical protein
MQEIFRQVISLEGDDASAFTQKAGIVGVEKIVN